MSSKVKRAEAVASSLPMSSEVSSKVFTHVKMFESIFINADVNSAWQLIRNFGDNSAMKIVPFFSDFNSQTSTEVYLCAESPIVWQFNMQITDTLVYFYIDNHH